VARFGRFSLTEIASDLIISQVGGGGGGINNNGIKAATQRQ
jgi:hypothetical protein